MVKISCLPVSLYGEFISGERTILPWARQLSAYGLDGMDISPYMLGNATTDEALASIKRNLLDIGIPVAMYVTYSDFTNPVIPVSMELTALEVQFKKASLLGAELLRITVGQEYPNLSWDWVTARLALVFERIVQLSKLYGVQPVLENHGKPNNWNYRDYTADRDNFLSLLPLIGNIGINFDTANPMINGYDTLDLMHLVKDRITSVHVADTAEYGTSKPVIVGKGVVPMRNVVQNLHEMNFKGWMCIEEASGLGNFGIEQSIIAIKEHIWETFG
jgi:sugar phosphate isomerase/epimerase